MSDQECFSFSSADLYSLHCAIRTCVFFAVLQTFTRLKKYSRHEDFTPDKIGAVSLACKSMCHWVLAMEHYHEVYKVEEGG